MSEKVRPHYADPKSIIVQGFDGNGILAEGSTVPADTTPGYAPGCHFIKRGGAAGDQFYVNQGTAASCAFKVHPDVTKILAGPTAAVRIAAGVASVTGSGDVATGLTTVTTVTATMQANASLTNGTSVTATVGDQAGTPAAGSVTIKVWKPTASGDATPVASGAAVSVNWIAVGT